LYYGFLNLIFASLICKMKEAIIKHQTESAAKKLVAMVMMLLLLWITGINFLYLSKDGSAAFITCIDANGDEDTDCTSSPTSPDEKSPDAPITVTEEFLHEYHSTVNALWVNMLFQHKVHEAEKLCIFHPESFSPPPEA
jgi:hypothetical protein